MSAPKKASAAEKGQPKAREIGVIFDSRAKEFLHFNRFLVELDGVFLHLWLGYEGKASGGRTITVFHGIAYLPDLKSQKTSFQDYISKIGGPSTEPFELRFPNPDVVPVAFHNLGFARHGDAGEVIVQQVSQKMMIEGFKDAGSEVPQINGVLYGSYTSPLKVHKCLVYTITEHLR